MESSALPPSCVECLGRSFLVTGEAFETTHTPAALMLGSGILQMCPAWCLEEHVLLCFSNGTFLPCWYLVLTFLASMSG